MTARVRLCNIRSVGSICYNDVFVYVSGNERATCVAMRADPPTGLWENKDCSGTQHFICQSPRQGYTVPPYTTPYSSVPCPSGWLTNGGHCLKVMLKNSVLFLLQSSGRTVLCFIVLPVLHVVCGLNFV